MTQRFDADEAARRIVSVQELMELAFTGRPPPEKPSN
jgi:hypothetical protein